MTTPGMTPALATPRMSSGSYSRATLSASARQSSPNSGQSISRTPRVVGGIVRRMESSGSTLGFGERSERKHRKLVGANALPCRDRGLNLGPSTHAGSPSGWRRARSNELLAAALRRACARHLPPEAPGLSQRGPRPGAARGVHRRDPVVPSRPARRPAGSPLAPGSGDRLHQDGAARRGDPALPPRAGARSHAERRALRHRVPAHQAGRGSGRGAASACVPRPAPSGSRRRPLGPPRGGRAARAGGRGVGRRSRGRGHRVIRPPVAALAALLGACGSLPTTSEGVALLEIRPPADLTVIVGDSLRIGARALDREGNPLDVLIHWRTPDTTITVGDTSGVVIGVAAGSGREL